MRALAEAEARLLYTMTFRHSQEGRNTKAPGFHRGLIGFSIGGELLDRDVLGLRTLVALYDFEFDRVAFLERLET
jgi:hypothetical protein